MRITLAVVAGIAALLAPGTATASPPTNDDFANATTIAALPFSETVDPTEATVEPGEPACVGPADIHTVWYRLTPTTSGTIRASTTGLSYSPTIAVYTRSFGVGFSGLSPVACGYAGDTNVPVQAGQTYYLKVGFGWWETWSVRPYSLSIILVPPPPNDAFANAKNANAIPYVDGLDATAATLEAGEPTIGSTGFINASVWYRFTPASTMSVEANFDGSGLGVYTGNTLAALSRVAGVPGPFRFTFQAVAGTTYYIQLSRFSFDSANSTIRVALRLLPGDTTPPEVIPFVYGTLGRNGWYVSDVTVSWSVHDLESQILSTSGCSYSVVTSDTPGLELSCSATSLGGTRAQRITVKRDTSAPRLEVPAALAVNATAASGTNVSYTATATDALDPNPTVSCTPTSGQLFSIGDTTVSCMANDAAGNSSQASFTVRVKGAAEQLSDLLALVDSFRLEKLGTSLHDKLAAVQELLAAGKKREAEESLHAFINQVSAQARKGLSDSQAAALIDAAQRIVAVIDA